MTCLHRSTLILALGLISTTSVGATPQIARERARLDYERGVELMKDGSLEEAVRSLDTATRTDPTFDMAFYMLGRAQLSLKNYASAVMALNKCRDLHLADAARASEDRREGDRLRKERVEDIRRSIEALEKVPQSALVREQIRQYELRIRQLENIDREAESQKFYAVPAYVSLSLGSAYFRAGNLAEAEKAYLETVDTDPKIGEAHNNLAVVYMETGRYAEAEKAVKAAEGTGFKVPQALKDEIRKRKGGILPVRPHAD